MNRKDHSKIRKEILCDQSNRKIIYAAFRPEPSTDSGLFLSDCPLQVCHYKMDIHPEMSIDESFKKRYTVCRNLIIGMKGAWKVSCGKKSTTF